MFNCCKPLLVVAVPHELTDSSLEKVQQQLNQINVSLGETPGPQLGGNGGGGGRLSEGLASTCWGFH